MIDVSNIVLPPIRGCIGAVACTTTTAWVDLSQAGNTLTTPGDDTKVRGFFSDRIINLQADGGDVYFALSNDQSTALNPAATGVPTDAVPAGTICFKIPSGQERNYRVPATTNVYLAYRTASGTATLRFHVSSAQGI